MMIRKSILALSILAMSLGTIAVTSAGASPAASPTKVTFKGSITCKVEKTSVVKIKPGMSFGTPSVVTVTVTLQLDKCTGKTKEGGATIESGTAVAKVKGKLDCYELATTGPSAPKGTITWKTKGNKAANSTVTLDTYKLVSGKTSSTITYVPKLKGSFAGKGKAKIITKQSPTQLLNACNAKGGLTTIPLASGSFSG